jgi:hypothetical protein
MSVSLTIHARADRGVSDIHASGLDSKYAPSIFLEDSAAALTVWDLPSAYALQEAVNRVIAWHEDRLDRENGLG